VVWPTAGDLVLSLVNISSYVKSIYWTNGRRLRTQVDRYIFKTYYMYADVLKACGMSIVHRPIDLLTLSVSYSTPPTVDVDLEF